MKDPLPQLRRAGTRVRATDIDVTLLGRREQRPALRTVRGHDEFTLGAITQIDDRAEHFRDHITGLADHHRVADQHTLAFDLRTVVQRRQAHRGPGDAHRGHERERRHPAGSAHVDPDVHQRGLGLLGRVLVGHRPPGRTRGGTQATLLGEVVDLHHHTVDLMLDLMAALAPVLDAFLHCRKPHRPGGVIGDRQPPRLHRQIRVVQGLRTESLRITQSVADHPKRTPGGDGRVLLS